VVWLRLSIKVERKRKKKGPTGGPVAAPARELMVEINMFKQRIYLPQVWPARKVIITGGSQDLEKSLHSERGVF